MCDICRIFRLCHGCNQKTLEGPGYILSFRRDEKKEYNDLKDYDHVENVAEKVKEHQEPGYIHDRYSLQEAYCTECSKKIAQDIILKRKRGHHSIWISIGNNTASFQSLVEFPIIGQYDTYHSAWGSNHHRPQTNVWIKDFEGDVWFHRGDDGWGRFRKISKTEKQVLKQIEKRTAQEKEA